MINCVECIDPDKDKVIADIRRKGGIDRMVATPKDLMSDRIHVGICPLCEAMITDKSVYVDPPEELHEFEGQKIAICSKHPRV